MDIVWNAKSRRRALRRIADEFGFEDDPTPQVTGVLALVTGVGDRARNRFYLAVRIAILVFLIVAVALIRLIVPENSVLSLALALGLVIVCHFVTVSCVPFHVLLTNDDALMLVRVSKIGYRVKGVTLHDTPPKGVIEVSSIIPWLLPDVGRYSRPGGDVYFHVFRLSANAKNWLRTRLGREHSVPPRVDE